MKLTETWVQQILDESGSNVELVALEDAGNRRHRVIRLYIDHPRGISHELCANVSGLVGAALDTGDVIDGPYTLEVSSPGLERPLTKPAHFEAQLGNKVNVRTAEPVGGRRTWRGVLREVRGDEIVVDDGAESAVIGLGQIARANLVYEFEQGRSDE